MNGIPFTGIYLITGIDLPGYAPVNHLIEQCAFFRRNRRCTKFHFHCCHCCFFKLIICYLIRKPPLRKRRFSVDLFQPDTYPVAFRPVTVSLSIPTLLPIFSKGVPLLYDGWLLLARNRQFHLCLLGLCNQSEYLDVPVRWRCKRLVIHSTNR